MARTRGAFNFTGSLEIKKTSPLDARTLVNTYAELILPETWQDESNNIWLYNNIVVTVGDKQGLYMLINYDPVTAPDAYKDTKNWKAIDASAATIEVVNNLTSSDTNKALSAAMGKELQDSLDVLENSLSSVYTYAGSVDNYEDLPVGTEGHGVATGTVYNVVNAHDNVPAGTNYAWTGKAWDALGGSVDLSNYVESATLTTKLADYAKQADLTAVSSKADKNEAALLVINGTEDTTGSLANTLKTAKTYTDDQLTGYVTKADPGYKMIADHDTKIKALETATEDLDTLKQQVATNKSNIETLMGEEATTGSIKNTVASYLDWQELN